MRTGITGWLRADEHSNDEHNGTQRDSLAFQSIFLSGFAGAELGPLKWPPHAEPGLEKASHTRAARLAIQKSSRFQHRLPKRCNKLAK